MTKRQSKEPPVGLEYIRLRCKVSDCGCWEWPGYMRRGSQPHATFRRPDANGVIGVEGWPVRRLVYAVTRKKPLPNGKLWNVRATCENERCVAPGHLTVVRRGSYSKGTPKPPMHGYRISRTKSKASKISDEAVALYREPNANLAELAKEHGISLAYAYMLRDRQFRARTEANPFAGLGA